MSTHSMLALGVFVGLCGCGASLPPPQVPNGQAALDRLRATGRCETAIQAKAKIEESGEHGRIKSDLLMFAAIPARMRMDAFSPFGSTLLTLTSDGKDFSLADFREK